MKYKVGDKVKIINCKIHKNCEHLGKIYTVKYMYEGEGCQVYTLSGCDELFKDDELELVKELVKDKKFNKSDLKDGDIVYLRNGIKGIVVNDATTIIIKIFKYRISEYTENLIRANRAENYLDIIKVERPVRYTTIFKKEEILDEVEKRYLRDVIRPFRDRVDNIYKYGTENMKCFIKIVLDNNKDSVTLPYFESNTMYKGMKLNKKYTLEELGL